MATSMDKAADDLVSEVRRAYNLGLIKVKLSPDSVLSQWTGGIFKSATFTATQGNMISLNPVIIKWADTYRRWAEQGKRDDGSKYSWEQWVSYGKKELLGAIKGYTGVAWNDSILVTAAVAAKDAAVVTAQTVKAAGEKVVEVVQSPWLKVALIGGGVLAALYFLTKMGVRVPQAALPPAKS